ncbi:hypothetical protein D9C73_005203 [Collichthys lucidus]|uniref:Rhodopsin N-terminal domain-containing protein n=1 Tax=Collichthys lucidus TaxID=240159 RepID=A0A4U5UA92_COLLU|nr:hypothetical protein D9C73_005203 [Collichthys lucidus]
MDWDGGGFEANGTEGKNFYIPMSNRTRDEMNLKKIEMWERRLLILLVCGDQSSPTKVALVELPETSVSIATIRAV